MLLQSFASQGLESRVSGSGYAKYIGRRVDGLSKFDD